MSEIRDLVITFLIVYLCKLLYDFRILGGFNYPLLLKIVNMLILIFILMMIFHFMEVQNAFKQTIRQTKMEEYFKKRLNQINGFNYIINKIII